MLEVSAYIAMLIVLVSFTMKDMVKLRILNSIACAIFVVYGIAHDTMPIVVMNISVILINVYYLIKTKRTTKIFEGSKPLTGFEADVLSETLSKTSKSTPTLPGRK